MSRVRNRVQPSNSSLLSLMRISGLLRTRRASPGRATRSARKPRLGEIAELLLSARCRLASLAWIPSPADQMIACHVLDDRLEALAAVAGRVLELLADRPKRFADPSHAERRKMPVGIARNRLNASRL